MPLRRLLLLGVLAAACAHPPAAPVPPGAVPSASSEARARRYADWELGVRAAIARHGPALRDCYERELRRVEERAVAGAYRHGRQAPPLAGTAELVVVIERSGEVKAPRLDEDTLQNDRVRDCVLGEARSWRFAPPPVDVPVEIALPMRFELMGPEGD